MNYKVFMKIFFEKTKYFLLYSLMMTTFWYVLFIDVADAVFASHYEKRTPDIEITGKKVDNTSSILYENLDVHSFDILKNDSVEIYGLKVRELYKALGNDYQENYRFYGADEGLINELKTYLKRGKFPKAGKREAVIGSNLAKYLNANVGDVLNIPVENSRNDSIEYEYVVSGILANDMSFYSDGIYILKDSMPKEYQEDVNNLFYIYTKNNSSYNIITNQLESLDNNYGNILLHRENKALLYDILIKSLVKTIPLSAAFLSALFISLMKYTGRKIGLMKALGLSDYNIMSILIKGFGVFNLCGILNSFVAIGFIRLASENSISISALLYTVCSYAIIFIVTLLILFIMCKSISAKKAMYQY